MRVCACVCVCARTWKVLCCCYLFTDFIRFYVFFFLPELPKNSLAPALKYNLTAKAKKELDVVNS